MKFYTYIWITILTVVGVGVLSTHDVHAEYPLDIPDGSDWNIADIFYPSLHINMTVGDSSEDPSELAVGGHDPNDNFVVQGIEPSLSLRLTEHIEGFATLNFSYGADDEWVDEWEEYFAKLTKLPGGLELRGGRMLNRFGLHNATHLHSWSAVDTPLVNGYFLGEEGLAHEGGEVTWYLPTPFVSALSVSYGDALAHDHAHGEEEHGAEEEGHGHEEELFEEAAFADELFTVNALMQLRRDDFNQVQLGASFATGDNGLGSDTDIFGLNGSYVWRENGYEPGGRSLTWNNEIFFRDIGGGEVHDHGHEEEHHGEEEHHEEEGHHDEDEEHHADEGEGESTPDEEEFGFYSELIYGANDLLDVALRVGFVEGIDSLGAPERFRVSPWVNLYLSKNKNVQLRLQYNYDDLPNDEAHSVWAQLQTSFGAKEVR